MFQIEPLSLLTTLYINNKENEKLISTLLCQFYLSTRKARHYIHTEERLVRKEIKNSNNSMKMYRSIRNYQDSIEEKYLFPVVQTGYSYLTLKKEDTYNCRNTLGRIIDKLDEFIKATRDTKKSIEEESKELPEIREQFSELTTEHMKSIVEILKEVETHLFNTLFNK